MKPDLVCIGGGAGFSGDRLDAPEPVVDTLIARGHPAAMIFETIGERTLALAQLERRRDPQAGYEPMLDPILRPILKKCAHHNIPIIGNFGVANPQAAARLIHRIGREVGLNRLRIAVVDGDDIRDRLDLSRLEVAAADASLQVSLDKIIAANVYLGAREIVTALQQGAQVVVTGRVADPALALGPLVHYFDWDWRDWDTLGAGTLVGHLLECASQVSGGYFADPGNKEVPDLYDVGFPIAEVQADGSAVITKADATGGVVNARTVKEQMLYELHDPGAYLTPDVIMDINEVTVEEIGPDRVRVQGARGRPRPDTLKATVSAEGGWLGEGEISYAGVNATARARLAAKVLEQRLQKIGLEAPHRIDLIGLVSVLDSDRGALRQALDDREHDDIRVRLAVSCEDRERAVTGAREVLGLYNNGPGGGGGVRWGVTPRIKTVSYLVPREQLRPEVRFFEETP